MIGQAALRRGKRAVWAAAGSMAAISVAAWLVDPVRGPVVLGVTASLSGALVFGIVLPLLGGVAEAFARPPSPERRRLLLFAASRALAVVGGAAFLDAALSRLLAPDQRVTVRAARASAARDRARFPVISGLSPEVTPVADHYVVDIDISDPVVAAGGWRLRVDGAVSRALDVGFDELQTRFEMVQEHSVLTCISNRVGGPLVGNSLWEGPRLREVVAAAEPAGDATTLVFHCADGYSAAIPLELAEHDSTLVAIAQNGEALAREHGFPCRIRVPSLYGMMNAKWVDRIEVRTRPFEGYWARQGWSKTGVVRTQSRIDTPRRAHAGVPTWIAGVAWAGVRGIARVEVSTDGGRTWDAARLHDPLSRVAWTQWAHRWTPAAPGTTVLVCRAADGTGALQDSRRRPPHPSGASGYHVVRVPVAA
jgi:DMSO/TMAO reductase YedYZ molybdopterin-dependent catalytic subunit